MSLPGCAPDLLMTWVPMRALAVKIDALAVTLNTPGYTNLVDIPDAPFQYTDKILESVGFHQTFYLNGSVVADRAMTTDKQGNAPYTLPHPNLANLAELDELYYVADQDECLCKTIYKVKSSGTDFTLVTAGGSKCCQGLPVPTVGQDITLAEQHLLPKGLITQYLRSNYSQCCGCCVPEGLSDMDACSSGGAAYAFTEVDPGDELCKKVTRLSRKIPSGYFTWPFKKRYMELLVDKINYILQCARNDGTKPETIYRAGLIYQEDGGDFWFQQGSTCPTWQSDQWLASMSYTSSLSDIEDGTLVYGNEEVISRLDRSNANPEGAVVVLEQRGETVKTDLKEKYPRPWLQKTPPTAEDCEEGPKVYAYTLNSLSDLVDILYESIWPYGTFDPPEAIGCPDDDIVYCCSMTAKGLMSRVACGELGGIPVADEAACCTHLEALCSSLSGRDCDDPIPCNWDSEGCSCDCPEYCIESYECCCPGEPLLENVCQGPINAAEMECPPGCFPVTYCFAETVGNCCYPDGGISNVIPDGFNNCDTDEFGNPTFYCEAISTSCSGSPSALDTRHTPPPLTPPIYPELPSCDKPCCLTHPVFGHGDKGCLQYIEEIEDFLIRATDGMFYTCRWKDLRYVDPENPATSAVVDCATIACGLLCNTAYEELIGTPGHPVITCLNQAPMMYSFERRVIIPDDSTLLDYYDILITAPSTFP